MANIQVAQQERTNQGTREIVARVDNSPLPPSHELERLKAIDSTLVEFVSEEIRKENEFRRSVTSRRESTISFLNIAGLLLGSALAALLICASVFLVLKGFVWSGSTLGISTVAGVVATIINAGNNARRADTEAQSSKKKRRR